MNPAGIELCPHRYVKTRGGLSQLSGILSPLGKSIFILFGPLTHEKYGIAITELLEKGGFLVKTGIRQGECCEEEGRYHLKRLKDHPPEVVVGMGGGKTIDLAKWVASRFSGAFVAIPTSTATCAATTPVSELYTAVGIYEKTVETTPPVLTLVDPDILAQQPPRLLAAGMANAMAKWIESRGLRKTYHKHIQTASALSLSRLAYEFLSRQGTRALEDLRKETWTPTLSEVCDIVLFLAGLIYTLGEKTMRDTAAHAFRNAFQGLNSARNLLHGECLAFGMIFQMVLEKTPLSILRRHLILFERWGLPLTLEALGLDGNGTLLETGIQKIMAKNSLLTGLMLPVRPDQMRAAIMEVDRLGREIKIKKGDGVKSASS